MGASLRRLGVERLELCYLHRIDHEVALADQLGTLKALQDDRDPDEGAWGVRPAPLAPSARRHGNAYPQHQ
ncbi:hypothetical protein [Streptomyces microflavus]|uniref:hypothetical protein n=1 Tax=Streptomyces microflavus TaxID=1919 RepID=UPI001E649CFC|nr:hypothetical protein [Streptomyces microflavus]